MGICSSDCTVVIFISQIKSKPDFKNNWKSTIVGIKIALVTEVPNPVFQEKVQVYTVQCSENRVVTA